MSDVLPTQNPTWGFHGGMGDEAAAAWPLAFVAIQKATGAEAEAVRAFLDSRHGRHFADQVAGWPMEIDMALSINTAVRKWMAWHITPAASRQHGVPVGEPYLRGLVMVEAMAAEDAP